MQHAKREQTLPHLLPYETEAVRSIVREVRELNREVSAIREPFGASFDLSSDPPTACALIVNYMSIRRNKRCLLAYHRVRVDKLEELCWKGIDLVGADPVVEESGTDGAAKGNSTNSLSPEEEEYVRLYGDLLSAYKGRWTDIDLTGSLEPPRDLFIDVRVLKDAGEIQTEYG